MRVLVTGGRGFVGSYLVPLLRSLGHEVYDPSSSDMDVLDAGAIQRKVTQVQPDTIVHLAAVTTRPKGEEDAVRLKNVNITGASNVAKHSDRCHLVFTSTCHVYGTPKSLPIVETHPLLGQGDYAESKIQAEGAVVTHAHERSTILRLFNLLGPGQIRDFAIADWCWTACEREDTRHESTFNVEVGDLTLLRDYLDVRDAAEAIACVVEAGRSLGGKAINVCSGESSKLEYLFSRCAPKAVPVIAKDRLRPSEVREIVGCNKSLIALGWQPKHPLEASIADMRSWIYSRLS